MTTSCTTLRKTVPFTGLMLATAITLAALFIGPASADDRDLFRAAASEPYVFMLFDTSGSMHWQFDNSFAVTSADDPQSKLYQAKSALFQVLRNLDPNVRLGWAHFPQEALRIQRKHWAYTRKAGQPDPPWMTEIPYPLEGIPEHFGRPTGNDGGDLYTLGACDALVGANGGAGETELVVGVENAYFHPKLGDAGANQTTVYFRLGGQAGQDYRLRWHLVSGSNLGDNEITVEVQAWRETGCDAGDLVDLGEVRIVYEAFVKVDSDGVVMRDATGPLPSDFIARTEGGLIPGNRTFFLNGMTTQSNCAADPSWYPNDTTSTGPVAAGEISQLAYDVFDVPNERYGSNGTCTAGPQALSRGSILPWDWVRHPSPEPGFELSSRDELLCRLAPNTCSSDPNEYHVVNEADKSAGLYVEYEVGDRVPDFRVARYFENARSSGMIQLKASYLTDNYQPLAAYSGTPLAGMMRELDGWADFWEPCAQDPAVGDRNFICRERYAIILTDGAETCETAEDGGRNVALRAAANALRARGIRTFVVGFGVGVDAAQLEDIADFGGTGVLDLPVGGQASGDGDRDCLLQFPNDPACRGPILADNKQALIDSLNNLFQSIKADEASFASAAVPVGQSNAQDSIFLTNFVPLDGVSTWAGDLSHYVRPLPLKEVPDGEGGTRQVPDESKLCSTTRQASCLAWKANESMLGTNGSFDQVADQDIVDPTTGPVTNSSLKSGNGTGRRRLYFGRSLNRRNNQVGYNPPLFRIPGNATTRAGLFLDSGLMDDTSLPTGTYQARLNAVKTLLTADPDLLAAKTLDMELILRKTYAEKEEPNPLDSGSTNLNYILGDIFHSDPQQLGEPSNLDYLQGNLPKGSSNDCNDLSSTSYSCFFFANKFRRKVVFAGANDGQYHAFDAGTFDEAVQDDLQVGEFNLGTGQELFAFIPSALLPRVAEIADGGDQEYGVDGEIRIADVFIDPKHTGNPSDGDRQWRTILMGSFREGGETVERLGALSSYFALDITRPDRLVKSPNIPIAEGGEWVPETSNYVPSCISNYSISECGPVKYGAVLWEFSDLDPVTRLPNDEDVAGPGVGASDLAPTWSRPTIGRVRVTTQSGNQEDRYVAVFGGGFDPEDSGRGNWLFILDMETGKTLAKRQLEGPVPSAPAAVDTDGDAYLDTVYVGTTLGNLYKIDISSAATVTNTGRVEDTEWIALKVFEAGIEYPMFTPPSVIFVPSEDRFAVSFGVGNRSDLWDLSAQSTAGRFYSLLDTGWEEGPSFVPFTESDFETFAATDTTDRDNLFSDPPVGKEPGWILTLEPGEKLLARPFTLAGVTIFSTYVPLPLVVNAGTVACERDGGANIFTVFTTSGNALLTDRFRSVPGIVSNPFTEVSGLQARGGFGQSGGGGPSGGGGGDPNGGDVPPELAALQQAIQDQFPEGCKFNSESINVKVVRQDTGIEFIVPISVCVDPTGWRDL